MSAGKMGWALGILGMALWLGTPYVAGQQQPAKSRPVQARSSRHTRARQARTSRRAGQRAGTPQISSPAVGSGGATATAGSVPQGGTPTLENPRPTATLDTLPNQTLTPGATTVPSNSGGIAPASNDASSGEYTPSEGYTAPTTPGGNPSETQGVPTFSSAAQPSDANLPRAVAPAPANRANGSKTQQKPH